MKKHIVIISIYYPPIQSIASNRLYSFSKYLNKDKFDITVVTLASDIQTPNGMEGVDVVRVPNTLFFKPLTFTRKTNKLHHYAKVIYNKTIMYWRQNQYASWMRAAEKTMVDLVNKKGIDLMLSSFAPVDTHLVALKIKQLFPQIKWIADMRDEMSLNYYLSFKEKAYLAKIEKNILKFSDAITSVSKPLLDDFSSLAKKEMPFLEIRNGFDFLVEDKYVKKSIFNITYMGNFYGQINPKKFLEALTLLYKEKSIDDFRISFIGVKTHFTVDESIKSFVQVVDTVPHSQAIELMQESGALLLIHPNNGRKGVFTGKLFEYMATLRPIIALVDPDDVAAKLIEKSSTGYVSDSEDVEAIKEVIKKAYNDWKNDKFLNVNIEVINLHHRAKQLDRLEKLIDRLLS